MLRPEQKAVNMMMGVGSKFCKAGELVLDTCTNALATVKALFAVALASPLRRVGNGSNMPFGVAAVTCRILRLECTQFVVRFGWRRRSSGIVQGIFQGFETYVVNKKGLPLCSARRPGYCAESFCACYARRWDYVQGRRITRKVRAHPAVAVAR